VCCDAIILSGKNTAAKPARARKPARKEGSKQPSNQAKQAGEVLDSRTQSIVWLRQLREKETEQCGGEQIVTRNSNRWVGVGGGARGGVAGNNERG
jgi:hypothetical protein